jgi:hypothetical protein
LQKTEESRENEDVAAENQAKDMGPAPSGSPRQKKQNFILAAEISDFARPQQIYFLESTKKIDETADGRKKKLFLV